MREKEHIRTSRTLCRSTNFLRQLHPRTFHPSCIFLSFDYLFSSAITKCISRMSQTPRHATYIHSFFYLSLCIESAHECATYLKVHCVYECHRRLTTTTTIYIFNERHFMYARPSHSHASSEAANENPFS